jgi:hypothetical protein
MMETDRKLTEEPLDAPERWLDRCGSDKRSEKDAEQCRLISKVTGCTSQLS